MYYKVVLHLKLLAQVNLFRMLYILFVLLAYHCLFKITANLFIQLGKLYSLFVIMVYCTVLSIFITW